MNLLFGLPPHLQEKVFQYDPTYYEIYNYCMVEILLNFNHTKELNKLLRNFCRQKLIFVYYANQNISNLLD